MYHHDCQRIVPTSQISGAGSRYDIDTYIFNTTSTIYVRTWSSWLAFPSISRHRRTSPLSIINLRVFPGAPSLEYIGVVCNDNGFTNTLPSQPPSFLPPRSISHRHRLARSNIGASYIHTLSLMFHPPVLQHFTRCWCLSMLN
jgi:hypothetical protein